jgi:hypothetical protein
MTSSKNEESFQNQGISSIAATVLIVRPRDFSTVASVIFRTRAKDCTAPAPAIFWQRTARGA